jgi:hypothetical protein
MCKDGIELAFGRNRAGSGGLDSACSGWGFLVDFFDQGINIASSAITSCNSFMS